jgi:hypothetical protein
VVKYLLPHHERLTFSTAPGDANASLTELRLHYFKDRFLSGISMTPEAYWADSWSGAISTSPEDKRLWLNLLFNAVLQSPEYQLA